MFGITQEPLQHLSNIEKEPMDDMRDGEDIGVCRIR